MRAKHRGEHPPVSQLDWFRPGGFELGSGDAQGASRRLFLGKDEAKIVFSN